MFNNFVLNDICTYKIRFMALRGKKFKQILADSRKGKIIIQLCSILDISFSYYRTDYRATKFTIPQMNFYSD